MPLVHNTVHHPIDGTPAAGAQVTVSLIAALVGAGPGYQGNAGRSVQGYSKTETDANGRWTATLVANDDLSPADTFFEVEERVAGQQPIRHDVAVPDAPTTTLTGAHVLPQATITVASATSLEAATADAPRWANVGGQLVRYTSKGATTLGGASGGTGTIANGATVEQAYWVGDILTDPPTTLPSLHILDPTDAHDASAISFASAGNVAAATVQAALVELDAEKQASGVAFSDLALQPGVDATGATECGAAINTGLEVIRAAGMRAYAKGTFQSSVTIIIQGHADLSDAILNYTGTTVGTQVGTATDGVVLESKRIALWRVVCVNKPPTGWLAGSIGVKVINANCCHISTQGVSGFETDLLAYGQAQGTVHTYFDVGEMSHGKRGLVLASESGGWVNSNTFGGSFRLLQNPAVEGTNVAGARQILLDSPSCNNNVFVNPAVEGDVAEYMIDVDQGYYNLFIAPRFEVDSVTPRVRWGAGAVANRILDGYRAHIVEETIIAGAIGNVIDTPLRQADWSPRFVSMLTGHLNATGTWVAGQNSSAFFGGYSYNSSDAQNDAARFSLSLVAGTWYIDLFSFSGPGSAISTVDYSIDGGATWIALGTVDLYAGASAAHTATLGPIAMAAPARVLVRFRALTRHASATNWFLPHSAFSARRTA